MKYRNEHTQHRKTSQLKWRSLYDLSLKHKSWGPAFPSMFPGWNMQDNWSTVIPISFSVPFSSIRGRFGQVHKCVENSSGLTLAAKVIKARSLKEKVRECHLSWILLWHWCVWATWNGAEGILLQARNVWPRKDGALSQDRWQLRPFIVSACLCVRLPVSGRRWWRMRSRSWITWTTPTWSSSTQHTSPGMTSSLYSNSMFAFVNAVDKLSILW